MQDSRFKKHLLTSITVFFAIWAAFASPSFAQETEEFYGNPSTSITVNVYDGQKTVWSKATRHSISYCVSYDFGANHAYVLQAVREAIADWQKYADVTYTHRPEHDNNCNAWNNAVTFDVSPIYGQDYLMKAFFPNYARSERNILVDDSSFGYAYYTFLGIMKHELGHTLGFRHEHIRVEGGCAEGGKWAPVTAYDSSSVMHYPHCPGGTGDILNLVLTETDQKGAAYIYAKSTTGPIGGTIANGVYNLRSSYSNKCLDVRDHSLDNGARLQQWGCTGENQQRFLINHAGGDYYTISGFDSRRCVSSQESKQDNGNPVLQWDCANGPDQLVRFVPSNSGSFTIRFSHSNKCMDVDGPSFDDGKLVQQWECLGGPNQDWFLDRLL